MAQCTRCFEMYDTTSNIAVYGTDHLQYGNSYYNHDKAITFNKQYSSNLKREYTIIKGKVKLLSEQVNYKLLLPYDSITTLQCTIGKQAHRS
jgi:hypothetical protein